MYRSCFPAVYSTFVVPYIFDNAPNISTCPLEISVLTHVEFGYLASRRATRTRFHASLFFGGIVHGSRCTVRVFLRWIHLALLRLIHLGFTGESDLVNVFVVWVKCFQRRRRSRFVFSSVLFSDSFVEEDRVLRHVCCHVSLHVSCFVSPLRAS